MEDDRFLKDFGREPRPEFARSLRAQLRAGEEREESRGFVFRPAFAIAAALLVVVAMFSVPAVRVSAQALLDMFRVRNFAAVPFNAERMEKLQALKRGDDDPAMMAFDHQVIQEPTETRVATLAEASALAGNPVRTPGDLPDSYTLNEIEVNSEGRMRLTVDAAKLQAILQTLDLRDVRVPAGLDGQPIEVHMWPLVTQSWSNARGGKLHLVQSRSPEVAMRSGVDLRELGEMGLRILGLDASEARRVAGSIDWANTLVVPVPAGASSFREVTVRGNKGLMVEMTRRDKDNNRRQGAVVMWNEGDQVFALSGSGSDGRLIQIAESLR